MNMSPNQKKVAGLMDRYHHRAYVPVEFLAAKLGTTSGRARSTCVVMEKHGYLEEGQGGGWRFTPQGRKWWRGLLAR